MLRASWDCSLGLGTRGGYGRAGYVCWETKAWVLCPSKMSSHISPGLHLLYEQARQGKKEYNMICNKVDFAAALPLMTFIFTKLVYRYLQSVNFFLK